MQTLWRKRQKEVRRLQWQGQHLEMEENLSIRSLLSEYLDDLPQDIDASIDSRNRGNFHRVLNLYVDADSAELVFETASAVIKAARDRQERTVEGSDEHNQLELLIKYLMALSMAAFSNINDDSTAATKAVLRHLLQTQVPNCKTPEDAEYFTNAIEEV
jgi:hypothetical protein